MVNKAGIKRSSRKHMRSSIELSNAVIAEQAIMLKLLVSFKKMFVTSLIFFSMPAN